MQEARSPLRRVADAFENAGVMVSYIYGTVTPEDWAALIADPREQVNSREPCSLTVSFQSEDVSRLPSWLARRFWPGKRRLALSVVPDKAGGVVMAPIGIIIPARLDGDLSHGPIVHVPAAEMDDCFGKEESHD
jgi:hypothetical protein